MERYRQGYVEAMEKGAELVVFPELATTGYPPRDLLALPDFIEANLSMIEEMAAWTASGPPMIVGYIAKNKDQVGNDLLNAAAILESGKQTGTIHKSLLPSYDVFDEDRYFEHCTERTPIRIAGRTIGLTICEDIWSSPEHWNRLRYPVDPSTELAKQGIDFFINISASPFTIGKSAIRREVVSSKARDHGLATVYVNQVGAHDELIFDGRSMVVDKDGKVIQQLAAFQEEVAVVSINTNTPGAQEAPPQMCLEEEVYEALVLGVRDYVHKSGFQSICLGLSGGIDSALTAAIAVDALGPEHVFGVAMPTRYSSDHSVEDAEALARHLGCRYELIPIDQTFQAFLDQMAPVFAGRDEDVTEENLQARTRGVTLMAISNKEGSLLLTTGNKSEMAVGYCTMYGDMCGALAVIADVPKTLVYKVSKWINREQERIPWRTIEKPPSAELRPDQLDEDSLPPYPVLDAIIEKVVEYGFSGDRIAQELDLEPGEVYRIVRLIHQNEYKRKQAPPVLKVTTKAFGVGRRMPIVMRHRSWS